MSDPLRIYTKPSLSESELLTRWQERGLTIPDEKCARRYLCNIGYYRLSAYVRSFETGTRDVIRPDTTFDDVLSLYVFDRKLRLHVLDAIERIEVALRAALSDHMSRRHGPHWYEDLQHFKDLKVHQKLLDEVDDIVGRERKRKPDRGVSNDCFPSALSHYVMHFDEPARPPTWIVFEELNFGITRSVYDSLADKEVQASIAKSLGLMQPVLSSWLKTYQRIRNICAHHGRLWNRGLGVYPMLPKSSTIRWLKNPKAITEEEQRKYRLYPVLVSLQTILYTISPGSTWAARLHELFESNPNVPLSGIGVPDNWFDDPFWSRRP